MPLQSELDEEEKRQKEEDAKFGPSFRSGSERMGNDVYDRLARKRESEMFGISNEDQQQNYQRQLESDRALSQVQTDKEEQEKQNQPEESAKMGTMLFVILLILCVVADLIDMVTVGTVGWIIGIFVDAILLLAIGMSKGGRKQFKRIVIGVIGDSIPFLAVLPFRSGFLIWGFVKSRSKIVQSISSVAQKVV